MEIYLYKEHFTENRGNMANCQLYGQIKARIKDKLKT